MGLDLQCSNLRCVPLKKFAKRAGFGGVSAIGGFCSKCGLEVQLGLEMHNGAKICPVCHCCLHLDHAGRNMAGEIIHVKESTISQSQMNLICSIIFMAGFNKEACDTGITSELCKVYDSFASRSNSVVHISPTKPPIEKEYETGWQSGDKKKKEEATPSSMGLPSVLLLAQVLRLDDSAEFCLDGLRFLPAPGAFASWASAWSDDFFTKYPASRLMVTTDLEGVGSGVNIENNIAF